MSQKNFKKDRKWALAIKELAGRTCQSCGTSASDFNPMEAAHIFPRRYKSTRWDLENGLCMCKRCHFLSHQQPKTFLEWAEIKLGTDTFEALRLKSLKVAK